MRHEPDDIKTILQFKGGSIIGFSEYDNNTQNNDPVYQNKDFLIKNKCKYLVDNALNSQLLDNCGYINNASNALVNITGGHDMRLFEVGEIIELIRYQLKEDANIIFGTTIDEDYYGKIKLSLIVTGVPDSNINECNQNNLNKIDSI